MSISNGMQFSAHHKTFSTILEPNYKYIIPRYQREFSWDRDTHIKAFWDDLVEQIDTTDDSEYKTRDYFVGSVVLVGYEGKDTEFLVIDGQQRITTLTIFLSALTYIGFKLGKDRDDLDYQDFAEVCYRYIEGRDKRNKEFFKLVNETPKPFFQENIQYKDKKQYPAKTDEEKRLREAYDFFVKVIEDDLKKHIGKELEFLTVLRDQVLRFSVINITVNNEVYAQKIFETLNTKGKDLETIDLIKNKVFDVLNKEHPDDEAKTSWNSLKEILVSREDDISLSKFFYHYWVSKYNSVAEHKIYSSFLKYIEQTESSYLMFLEDIVSFAALYVQVVSPQESDWKEQDKKDIFKSLSTLRKFKLTAHRTIVVTLISLYKNRVITLKVLKELLYKMVLFHLVFIIMPFRTRIEITYAKYARTLNLEKDNKKQVKEILNNFRQELKVKLDDISFSEFEAKFMELKYSNSFTQYKDIIKFLFELIELDIVSGTKELRFDQVTLEHIEPQKTGLRWVDGIGNILPLGGEINGECDTKPFKDKLSYYNQSNLKQVKSFCNEYAEENKWTRDLAQDRASKMSKLIFDYIKSRFI